LKQTMVVEYENSLDDVLALNLYQHEQSPSARRTRRLLQFGPPAVPLLVFAAQVLFSGASLTSALPWLMFAAVWVIIVPFMLRRAMKKRVVQLFVEGEKQGIVGKHTLSLTSGGLTDKASHGRTKTGWRDVRKVVTTNQYVFIYLSDTVAHIVPRRAFPDERGFHEFRDTVIRYFRAATGS